MLLTMFLSLYTARIVLKTLGVEDFGIYNVVGGIVTFMGFLTASMSSATQRYLAFYLGKHDHEGYRNTYSLLINVYLVFCLVSFVILEIIGPYYISNYMVLPSERIASAQIVYQFSLIAFLFTTFTIPHRSSIIAYEKMGFFACVAFLEVILNLIIALGLTFSSTDNLLMYSALILLMNVIVAIIVISYCKKKLPDCRYSFYWDRIYFNELVSYAGWNLMGSITGVMNVQGQAIVLNSFFGPVVNAAKAISDRIYGMISQLSSNFYMAVAPQIIKSYSVNDIEYMRKLVLNSSRYSFFLLLICSVPLYCALGELLSLWLGEEQVSKDMIQFCKYTILYMLINVLEQPITMAIRATGNIKKYQLIVGIITLTYIPICIIIFYLGAASYYSVLLLAIIYAIAHIARVFMLCPIIQVNISFYYKKVIKPIIFVLIPIIIVSLFFNRLITIENINIYLYAIVMTFVALFAVLGIGIDKEERVVFINLVKSKFINK